jgi:hypothetical protein
MDQRVVSSVFIGIVLGLTPGCNSSAPPMPRAANGESQRPPSTGIDVCPLCDCKLAKTE